MADKWVFGLDAPSSRNGKQNPEYYRLYYAANRERILARNRSYHKATYRPVEVDRRRATQPYDYRLGTLNYRRMVKSLLVQRDGLSCGICQGLLDLADMQVDHIVQRALGGSDAAENLRLVHSLCNRSRPRPRRLSRGQ